LIPQVSNLKQLDVYRDGGSLSASFESKEKIAYCLFFKINHNEEKTKTRTYHSPVLEKYIENNYTSKITGVTSPDWKKETISINWENAVKILNDLKPFMSDFKSEYTWVFKEMEEIAANEGTKL